MFEKLTDQAAEAIANADEDAALLNHGYIGVEHLLLGLLDDEGGGQAARVLRSFGVTRASVLERLERRLEPEEERPTEQRPFTPRVRRVFELSQHDARDRDHISTGHLLLAIVEEGGGIAVHILADRAPGLDALRAEIQEALDDPEAGDGPC